MSLSLKPIPEATNGADGIYWDTATNAQRAPAADRESGVGVKTIQRAATSRQSTKASISDKRVKNFTSHNVGSCSISVFVGAILIIFALAVIIGLPIHAFTSPYMADPFGYLLLPISLSLFVGFAGLLLCSSGSPRSCIRSVGGCGSAG